MPRFRVDRSAGFSLILGVMGAVLTGLIHNQIMASSHFDFLARDVEFYLVLGAILIVIALAVGDLRTGMAAIRHMEEPHGKYAKPLALMGVTLGLADILPAAIILAIMLETILIKFAQIKVTSLY